MNRNRSTRRSFLGTGVAASAGLAIGSGMPGNWMQALANSVGGSDRILVVIQMSGGNDGLNTIVPYRNEDYLKARPKLAIGKDVVRKVGSDVGFHPAMKGLEKLVDAGRFSIIHGVGYAKPNRSHFESMDIWHTCASKEERVGDGWIGRYIAAQKDHQGDSMGMHLGGEQQPIALAGRGVQVPSIASIDQFRLKITEEESMEKETRNILKSEGGAGDGLLDFVQSSSTAALEASQRLDQAMKSQEDSSEFPSSPLGEKLRVISRLILAGLTTKIYYVTLDGFDTHSQQALAHEGLLRQWSEALQAFVSRLESKGEADRVLVMTFSEFGRRVAENASEGTDHGAAAPIFFTGPKSLPLELGAYPSLKDLDDGDLKFHTDFRRVYATVIEKWFKVSDSKTILGGEFKPLDLLS